MRGLVKDTLYTRYTRIQIQIKGLHKKGKNIKKEEISSGGNDCVKLHVSDALTRNYIVVKNMQFLNN